MKLFFGQSLWNKRAIEPYGIPQKANWKFNYMNQQYVIPMVHHFSEGISFDIFTILNTEELNTFYNKYKSIGDKINDEDYLCLQAESPIQELSFREIHINNKAVEIAGTSSGVYISGIKEEGSPQLKEMYQEYDFLQGKDVSFKVTRVHLKYLHDDQSNINELRLIPSNTIVFLPIKKHFIVETIKPQSDNSEIPFKHPFTNQIHSLYINEIGEFDTSTLSINNHPNKHIATLNYELVPPLADNETLLVKDIEVKTSDGKVYSTYDLSSPAIAIYVDNKIGIRGYPLHLAISKAYPETIEYVKFSIVGIEKEASSEEIFVRTIEEV